MNLSTFQNIMLNKNIINRVHEVDNATGAPLDTVLMPNPNSYTVGLINSKEELIKWLTIVSLLLSIVVSIIYLKKIIK